MRAARRSCCSILHGEETGRTGAWRVVLRAHGKPFDVRYAGRRLGDAVMIVANPAVAKQELNWQPQYDDLEFIVETALRWEDHLGKRNDR